PGSAFSSRVRTAPCSFGFDARHAARREFSRRGDAGAAADGCLVRTCACCSHRWLARASPRPPNVYVKGGLYSGKQRSLTSRGRAFVPVARAVIGNEGGNGDGKPARGGEVSSRGARRRRRLVASASEAKTSAR